MHRLLILLQMAGVAVLLGALGGSIRAALALTVIATFVPVIGHEARDG